MSIHCDQSLWFLGWQILGFLEKLSNFLIILRDSSELINQLSFVDHEGLWDMLDFEHLRDLWKFVDVHINVVHWFAECLACIC